MTANRNNTEDALKQLRAIRGLRQNDAEKPHKLLFLMALARMYERDSERTRLVALDDSLTGAFSEVTKEFCPGATYGSILLEYPFYHLTTDGLWTIVVHEDKRTSFNKYVSSPNMRLTHRRLLETVRGGQLEEDLDLCLRERDGNAQVQAFLSERLSELNQIADNMQPNQVREERAQYSLFAHEAGALDVITRHVKAHTLGETLSNLELHDKQSNRYFETDLVVVSRFGVYVVELKHWSGRIEIRPNSWLQNSSFFKPDPHKTNNFKAKLLRGLYDRKFPSFPPVYFESVVVLTNPDVEAIGCSIPKTKTNNPTFESIDRFLQYLKKQRQAKALKLSGSQCRTFADYVKKLNSVGSPRDFVFPGYEIVERLYQYEDRAEVVARRTDLRHRRLSRLRIFFLTAEDESAREKATATLNAVEMIGDHSNVLKVWDIPNENRFLVEGSDWSETGTLRDFLDRSGPLDTGRSFAIAAGLARGLAAAHAQYVVHRAVSPDNVLMVDGTPKLMNFDLSFQLEDSRVTVIPDASSLKRSPYIAPEIYTSGTVPEATADLFSLGVVLFEMLVGQSPFGCSTDLERTDGRLTNEQEQKLRLVSNVSDGVTDLVCALIRQDPSDRIADAGEVLAMLEEHTGKPTRSEATISSRQLASGDQSYYGIDKFECKGAESQIYSAIGPRSHKVALKLFNREVSLSRIVDEENFASAVRHPSIVRVDSKNQWEDGRYYIAFDWVSESNLRNEIDDGVRPDIDSFARGAEQLLDAIACLHQNSDDGVVNPIVHNDIKPENILVGHAGRLVIIDFGAASGPETNTYEGTEGYVAPDLRLGQERQYCEDGDLYALSVTLHEWLLGCRPGEEISDCGTVRVALSEWLLKGCSPEAASRYSSAEEMRSALQAALESTESVEAPAAAEGKLAVGVGEEGEPVQPERLAVVPTLAETDPNPFVPYLNSLHNRSAASENALAESQARSPFFGYIHVAHPIVDVIQRILTGEGRRHVVLTGHAGDGKSTIAVDIFRRLSELPLGQLLPRSLQRREDLGDISLVKDFSEWSPAERATLMQEMLDAGGPCFLLISNTGTLLDTFKETARDGNWVGVESDLLGAMNSIESTSVILQDAEFVLANLAMMDNLTIALQIFERMLAEERWAPCRLDSCRDKCPIYRNVSLMQANLPVVRDRLYLSYRRMYEYGTRLTLRQLCAHMAYMITSGLEHEDIVKMAQRAKPPLMTEFMFFNRVFGDNGSAPDPLAEQLRGVKAVREQGFGSQPCPTWERHLWLRSRGESFQLESALVPEDFETLRGYGAGLLTDDVVSGSAARDQVRRAVFFLHDFGVNRGNAFVRAFLRSNMLVDFVRWQTQDGEGLGLQESNSLHKRIMHVLQEHFTGVRLPEGASSDRHLFVTLNRHSHDVRQSAQVVLARYPEDDFRIALQTTPNPAGAIRRELFLEGPSSNRRPKLVLSLPFLDYVMLRNRGGIGKALQSSYIDRLERFKGQLIQHEGGRRASDIMLVRLRTNHTFRRQIFAVREGRLEVADA